MIPLILDFMDDASHPPLILDFMDDASHPMLRYIA